MSKVDDELTRRFQRAERPVGSDELFEGLARRRRRRRTLQRLEAGALAVAVLGATAAGFLALRAAFEEAERDVGTEPGVWANGQIVFAKEGEDDRLEIFASQPDGSGVRQLTETELNDSDPAVSPDGTMVAFAHQTVGGATIATLPIEGGPIAWQTGEHRSVSDPVWSPDGSRIAFLSFTNDTSDLYVATVGADVAERIALPPEATSRMPADGLDTLEHPSWSPDGSRIAIAIRTGSAGAVPSWDIAVIRPDGTGLRWLVATGDRDETVPAWSPDGARIAFLQRPATTPEEAERRTVGSDELWTVSAEGGSPQLVAAAVDALLRLGLSWAPDGSSLLVSDGDWIYRVDATPEGDVRHNFAQLVRGFSPSWQPVPAGSTPPVTPEPSVSPSAPHGKDIGLGFNLCQPERLGGIDFLGDGTAGAAWIGVPTKDDGTCPADPRPDGFLAAADADADGSADAWVELPWECNVSCVPYDATDLDADGREELVVASRFSIVDFYVLRYLGPPQEPSPVLAPVLVAGPGHEPAGLRPGEPLRIDAGGDAGYSSQIQCEGYPDAPVLVWSWSFLPVDSDVEREVHITKIKVDRDGLAYAISMSDYSIPADQPSGIEPSTDPGCGVDWDVWS